MPMSQTPRKENKIKYIIRQDLHKISYTSGDVINEKDVNLNKKKNLFCLSFSGNKCSYW